MKCVTCGDDPISMGWTDMHGVGYCRNCGTAYTVYHYGEDNKRIDKPTEVAWAEKFLPIAKRYWDEFHRRMPNGFSFTGYGTSYELASAADAQAFSDWLAQDAEYLKLKAACAEVA